MRPFTDLLRQPNVVAKDVDKGTVVLRRRDAPDLLLTRADREAERAAAVGRAGPSPAQPRWQRHADLQRAIEDAFPWSGALPTADRKAFVEELSRQLAAGADLDIYGAVTRLIAEWRSAAAVHADPKHPRLLKRRLTAAASDGSTSSE